MFYKPPKQISMQNKNQAYDNEECIKEESDWQKIKTFYSCGGIMI